MTMSICSICGTGFTYAEMLGPSWCSKCEEDRIKLAEAFLAETGTTWLYDKGAFVLNTVRAILDERDALK